MFDPNSLAKGKTEKSAKNKALKRIKEWSLNIIPVDLQDSLIVDVNEIVCGDPACAPVDTVITLLWTSGGKGIFALPLTAQEVTREDLVDHFPDVDTLTKWHAGKKARWPPLPPLRFTVGERVECRIGPHPVKGWAPGRIVKLYYREPNWPPQMSAPYQILLHDGRLIFAPQDVDGVIRLRTPPAPDAPSSPEIDYAAYAGDDEEAGYDEEDAEGEAVGEN